MLLSSRRTPTFPLTVFLRLLGPVLISGLVSGCFLGDAADGLQCEQDADCGIGVSCAADPEAAGAMCCGGSCLLASSSTGPNPTSTTLPTGSSSSTETDTATTGDGRLCGNMRFDVEEGEECDSTAPDGPPCSDACMLCGNGQVDEDQGEECDGGSDCDEGCLLIPPCGNGLLDPGEVCDAALTDPAECMQECTQWVAFDWEVGEEPEEFCTGGADCERWVFDSGDGSWGSGEYFHDDDDSWKGRTTWPEAILRSRAISFPELAPGSIIRVRLGHTYSLNYQIEEAEFVDYAELHLEASGSVEPAVLDVPLGNREIACVGGKSNVVAAGCVPVPVTAGDYCRFGLTRAAGERAGEGPSTHSVEVVDGLSAAERRLRFTLRYDCANFGNGEKTPGRPGADAWKISSVRVTVSAPPS